MTVGPVMASQVDSSFLSQAMPHLEVSSTAFDLSENPDL